MARTRMYGFETGSTRAEAFYVSNVGVPISTGTISIDSSIFRGGSKSLKVQPGSGATSYWTPTTSGNFGSTAVRWYIRVTVLPATARRIWSKNGGTGTFEVLLNPNGTLSAIDGTGAALGTSTTALTDTTRWYKIDAATDATSYLRIAVDGEVFTTSSIASTMPPLWGANDTVAATYTAYFDDIVIDSTYSTYPIPDSEVVPLPPVSDSQAGVWLGGGGGTTNLYLGVANYPPVGSVTPSNTNTIHTSSASGNTTAAEYRANLKTYSDAGINSWDTVVAVTVVLAHGEEVATGTKTGSFGFFSNPASASGGAQATFTYAADLGAAGTYPTNWAQICLTFIESPSLTLGSNPVVAFRKTDAGTRFADICMVLGYAEVQRGVAPLPPYVSPYPQLLAQ